jgi:DSF synthase
MNAIAEACFSPPIFSQIETRFDPEFGVLWGFMNPKPRPTFNSGLLLEAREFAKGISDSGGVIWEMGQKHTINYVIEASKVPGVYNLGGDLELFRNSIALQDREALLTYGHACIDNVFSWATCFGLPLTTIALVEGEAMGGGFESALSASVLIVEESARLGFPEILFNLFPGMGAYSLLSRKVGRRLTDEMISSGNIYTGRQLYDMGVVDVLAPDGAGEAAVHSYIKKHAKAANGRRGIEAARREVAPLSHDELSRIVTVWVEAALRLTSRDVRMMERLVRAQNRNVDHLEIVSSNVMPLQRTA